MAPDQPLPELTRENIYEAVWTVAMHVSGTALRVSGRGLAKAPAPESAFPSRPADTGRRSAPDTSSSVRRCPPDHHRHRLMPPWFSPPVGRGTCSSGA